MSIINRINEMTKNDHELISDPLRMFDQYCLSFSPEQRQKISFNTFNAGLQMERILQRKMKEIKPTDKTLLEKIAHDVFNDQYTVDMLGEERLTTLIYFYLRKGIEFYSHQQEQQS